MEAFAVAASVIQVAGAGLALAQVLYSLCGEASSSSAQMKDLAFHVKSTSTVLEEIGKIFQDENSAGNRPIISQNAMVVANEIGERCTKAFDELQEILDRSKQSTLGLVRFMMKTPRLKVLQLGLGEMRSNLQCMMQVIIYARLKAEPRSTFNESEYRQLIAGLIRQHLVASEQYRQGQEGFQQSVQEDIEGASQHSNTSGSRDITTKAIQSTTHVQPTPGPSSNPTLVLMQRPNPTDLSSPSTHKSLPSVRSVLRTDGVRGGSGEAAGTNESTRELPGHPTEPHTSNSKPASTNETAYLSALYLVCCPCFAHRRRQQRQTPARALASSLAPQQQQQQEQQPEFSDPPVYSYSHTTRARELAIPGIETMKGQTSNSVTQNSYAAMKRRSSLPLGILLPPSPPLRAPSSFPPSEMPAEPDHRDRDPQVLDSDVDRLVEQWTTLHQQQ